MPITLRIFVFLQGLLTVLPLYADVENPTNADPTSALFPESRIPIEEAPDKFTGELINMLMTLGMVIAVIFALSWVLKRMLNTKVQQDNKRSLIKVIERRNLSPKAGVYVLEIYDKTLVIGESPAGLHYLTALKTPEEVEDISFQNILERKNRSEQ